MVFRRAYCDWSRFREAKAACTSSAWSWSTCRPRRARGRTARTCAWSSTRSSSATRASTSTPSSSPRATATSARWRTSCARTTASVIGLAVKEATSPFFVKACDEFIYLRQAARAASDARHRRAPRQAKPGRAAGARRQGQAAGAPSASGRKVQREVPAIAREVVLEPARQRHRARSTRRSSRRPSSARSRTSTSATTASPPSRKLLEAMEKRGPAAAAAAGPAVVRGVNGHADADTGWALEARSGASGGSRRGRGRGAGGVPGPEDSEG